MSNIDELQRRITAAIDRIANGISNAGGKTSSENQVMAAALDDEKLANAQLTERVRNLKSRYDSTLLDIQKKTDAADERVSVLDLELQRMRNRMISYGSQIVTYEKQMRRVSVNLI